jgi:hypothetical protein
MRASLVLLTLAACASSNSVRRALVTDNIHPGEARAVVLAWHDAHNWCRGHSGDGLDEFMACHVAMLEPHTPAVESLVEYKDGRVDALAVLAPVPCRLTGFCDHVNPSEQLDPGYRPGGSWVRELAQTGIHTVPPDEIPPMHRRLLDAMEVELDHRYGQPAWANSARSAMTWAAPDGEHIALFLSAGGGWSSRRTCSARRSGREPDKE